MLSRFDRRVIAESVLDFVRACQQRFECALGGAHQVGERLGTFAETSLVAQPALEGRTQADAALIGGLIEQTPGAHF